MPYLLTFVAVFGGAHIFTPTNLRLFLHQARHQTGWILLAAFSLAVCLSPVFTYAHPYLLADNRHYTFYLWRRVWHRSDWPFLRYLPIPLYLFTLVSMWNSVRFESTLGRRTRWSGLIELSVKSLFFLLVAATIVPQQLIEVRYFVPAFVLWRLNQPPSTGRVQTVLELCWAVAINFATVTVFATKTFRHPNSDELQRIIW